MITCYLRYTIDPYQIEAFERYSRMILPLAAKYGGVHHGAFLPHEGPDERYRTAVRDDEVAKEAWRLAEETRCILSFERSFMRPVFAPEP
jgi:antibiotic biosynthesis monooxygenase (ABM) superfamily enzyme